ncbi:MAG: ABC transporter ATP-binding protein [Chloroflexota bacterium]|nr:ABC transporter ATP-binding protein [Chloroflexota bacterium]
MTLTVDRAPRSDAEFEGALGYAFRKGRGAVLRGAAFGMAWQATVVVVPFLAQRAIDEGLVPGDWWQLTFWLTLLLGTGLLTAICDGLRHRAATQAGSHSSLRLRGRLVRHLLGLDAGFHDRAGRGDVLTRITTDVNTVGDFIDFMVTWAAHSLAVVLVVLLMLQMDLELGLIGAAFIPVVLVLMGAVMRPYEARTAALREATARLATILHENIAGVRVIKGFGVERHQRERYQSASSTIVGRAMALARLDTAYTVLFASLPAAAMVAVLWWGGLRAIAGEVTVGMLLAYSAWMLQLTGCTEGQVERFLSFMQARASARRIDPLLGVKPAITDPPRPSALPPAGGALRFSNVTVTVGERRILDGVSLEVGVGEVVVLVGVSGSGKSTLLSLPPRLYDPQDGAVYLDGVDVRDLSLDDLRMAACLAAADAMLFRDTIAANIALGTPEASRPEIEHAARLAQAHRFIMELPGQYESIVGERGLTLSGGQRQRIALARAFMVGARVLLLDDASSSLDPATDAAVWRGLTNDVRHRTLLIATQRRRIATLADRVVLLDAGRVVAEGTDEELWATAPLYRWVLGQGDGE